MKHLIHLMAISVIFFSFAIPALAMEDEHTCTHGHEDTIEGLIACFQHHIGMGHITDQEVAEGLLDKLYAAESSLARQQYKVATNQLNALINLIEAQTGKAISDIHAEHMIDHIERVIENLN